MIKYGMIETFTMLIQIFTNKEMVFTLKFV